MLFWSTLFLKSPQFALGCSSSWLCVLERFSQGTFTCLFPYSMVTWLDSDSMLLINSAAVNICIYVPVCLVFFFPRGISCNEIVEPQAMNILHFIKYLRVPSQKTRSTHSYTVFPLIFSNAWYDPFNVGQSNWRKVVAPCWFQLPRSDPWWSEASLHGLVSYPGFLFGELLFIPSAHWSIGFSLSSC